MEAKDYFDEIAECWDSEYEYHVVARNTTALVSGAASGAYILDVGCGTGEMFARCSTREQAKLPAWICPRK